ncbi:MAG: glycosyltransferase family 4 protein [Planctomycetaceae bacterium]
MNRNLLGYWKRAKFEYSQWQWRRYFARCRRAFADWQQRFSGSAAQVLLGTHFHKQGGVRNHLLAIQKHSSLRVLLVPEETDLQSALGPAIIGENRQAFLQTPPPVTAVAVHTHVLPTLIDWAEIHAPRRLKWVHTHHLLYYPEAGRNGIEPWQHDLNEAMLRGARNCDVCLSVSRWEQQVLQRDYGIEAAYIPNGVDVGRCDKAAAGKFLKKFKVAADFVLWVGRLDPVKNPRAFVELASRLDRIQFVMIGGITRQDLMREYGLEKPANLLLLPQLPHADVLDAIATCRTLVVTSLREGLPTLVLEAMTLRRNIVVPDEAGCLDATDGAECAAVYRQGTDGSLEEALDRSLRQRIANDKGRARVLGEFDWRVVARKLDQIYQHQG